MLLLSRSISLYMFNSWIFDISQVFNGRMFLRTNSEESASLVLQGGPLDCPVHKSTEVNVKGFDDQFSSFMRSTPLS